MGKQKKDAIQKNTAVTPLETDDQRTPEEIFEDMLLRAFRSSAKEMETRLDMIDGLSGHAKQLISDGYVQEAAKLVPAIAKLERHQRDWLKFVLDRKDDFVPPPAEEEELPSIRETARRIVWMLNQADAEESNGADGDDAQVSRPKDHEEGPVSYRQQILASLKEEDE